MRLPGRTKIRIHSQVESKGAAPEPHASPSREIRGLHFLRQPKHVRIEGARGRFLTRWHRKLDVIEIDDFAHNSILRISSALRLDSTLYRCSAKRYLADHACGPPTLKRRAFSASISEGTFSCKRTVLVKDPNRTVISTHGALPPWAWKTMVSPFRTTLTVESYLSGASRNPALSASLTSATTWSDGIERRGVGSLGALPMSSSSTRPPPWTVMR